MKHNFVRILSLVIFFTLTSQLLFAQSGTGKITGKVTDKKTGEGLIGLSVKIAALSKGAPTDVQGRYTLGNLAAGAYTLEFSYVGYSVKKISDVIVSAGKVTELDVVMEESGKQLQEVVITTSAKKESLNALYSQQKNSAIISDGISAEVIRKSPDKNASEVLKRVSGTTIQDNKFVIVRGLSDRYNTASLDNGALPSTEPNRKAFSFDIIPSNLVDNIIIRKTASPDMPADFAGGSVQIFSKDIPAANFMSYSVGYGYNSATTFKNFKGGELTLSNYTGFNNSLNLPSSFPSRKRLSNLTTEGTRSAINSISRDWNTYNNTALPAQSYQFSLGQLKDFKSGSRLGAILSLSYRTSQTNNDDVVRNFYQYGYTDDAYKFSTSLGGLLNLGYSFGKSKITLKNIYNNNLDNQYLSREGYNSGISSDVKFYAFDVIQKTLFKTTLDGDHSLGSNQSKLKWTLAYSNIANNQPDQRKISYSRLASDRNNPDVKFSANILNLGKENARFFSDLNENIYSADVNFSIPVKLFKQSSSFKTGVTSQFRNRDFTARFIGTVLKSYDQSIQQRPLGTLFNKSLVNQDLFKLEEIGNGGDDYNANSLTNSGYVMLDNKLAEKLRLVWGLRAEQYNIQLETATATTPEVDQNQLDILPSANLTYSVTDKTNFRLSLSQTLARPEFRELAPFSYYDYEMLAITVGNPKLKNSHINNADLRFEFYPSAGQIVSASVFYKKFENAIEPFIYDVNSTPDISYNNAPDANLYGLEFELRKNLDFIGEAGIFKNTSFYTNFSLIKSKVKFTNIDNSIGERPLVGQSPYAVNAGLQHSAFRNKLSVNLLYNRMGRRINKVRGQQFPDIWEAPRDLVDLQLGLKAFKSRGEFKLNAGDLLNQKSVFYFDRNLDKKYTMNSADETIGRYKPGTNVSLSFSYSIK